MINSKKIKKLNNEREEKNMPKNKIGLVLPKNIKSLKEEKVQHYLENAVKCKSLNDIYAELNEARSPKTTEFSIKDICKVYVERQNVNNNEITQQQIKGMFKAYLESGNTLKSKDYKWLTKRFDIVTALLFKMKDQTAYKLSEQIYRKYNKVISGKHIKKLYARVGVYIKLGNREKATYRCGAYYRNRLNRMEKIHSKGVNQ